MHAPDNLHRLRDKAPWWPVFVGLIIASSALDSPASYCADDAVARPDEIVFRQGLLLGSGGRAGRSPVHEDAIESLMVRGKWAMPMAGDTVTLPDGTTRQWEQLAADEHGNFNHRTLAGGYLACTLAREQAEVMILEAAGHGMVYVNGEPRVGDPYHYGYVRLPVQLRAGDNDFLFQGGRGQIRAKLFPRKSSAQLDVGDATLPDLIVGQAVNLEAAVVVVHAMNEPTDGLVIEATIPGSAPQHTPLPPLGPLSLRKVAFRLVGAAPQAAGDCTVELKLLTGKNGNPMEMLDAAEIKLRVLRRQETHKRTFRSTIDDSVQYFAVVPPKESPGEPEQPAGREPGSRSKVDTVANSETQTRPALVLTLHGAGVEASGQAACYSSKPGVVTVAPTNRRPFGFDWEDWGRLDAIEVMDLAERQLHTDPNRTYLTGHSMGGHGVWHVGATFPDRFAAIGPSAGWVSMFSYAGARRPAVPGDVMPQARIAELLNRSMAPSDTLALSRNLLHYGVYVLHGEKDDNVPVGQARTMKQQLESMHKDFDYHEEPGAGHWWGKDLAEYTTDGATWGTACVDWPPMFRFFMRHTTPARNNIRHVEFVTASPGVSARSGWATIEAQTVQLKPSSVDIESDPAVSRFAGKTANVARLSLDVNHLPPKKPIQIELDGQTLPEVAWPETGIVRLSRELDQWSISGRATPTDKGPHRYGTFKDAFRNHVIFVIGTQGTPQENASAWAKARYDAEQFWYRGNGSIELIADTVFLAGSTATPPRFDERNIVLYGNADTNAAWPLLLKHSPVQVRRGSIRIGDHTVAGEDLACLLIYPRLGSDTASVGVVAGTGLEGMRLTERMPYFTSGVAFPDLTVLGSETLSDSMRGVRGVGFFGVDWTVASGEFAWRGD